MVVDITLVEPPIPVDVARLSGAKSVESVINTALYGFSPINWERNHWMMTQQYDGVGKIDHFSLPFSGTMPTNTQAEIILTETNTAILTVKGDGPENSRTVSSLNPARGNHMGFFVANGLLYGYATVVKSTKNLDME